MRPTGRSIDEPMVTGKNNLTGEAGQTFALFRPLEA